MKSILSLLLSLLLVSWAQGQISDPEITQWIINTTGITGQHYVSGNSTPISDTAKANVQKIRYSNDNVYVNCSGIPSYIIGPYLDGNPAMATNNNWLFQIPRNPVKNSGTLTETPLGPIGVFINGVPIYDYKDGYSYNNEGVWNRDAIVAENDGFDCAKGHPSPIFSGPPGPGGTLEGGSYHHHQNPTAFNLDLQQVSNVCDLYLADGLYAMDSTKHSPLLGYAFDGYPVYGAFAHANTDGTGGIKRMVSGYELRNITTRTTYANGQSVSAGPVVDATYPLGFFREDYEFTGNGDLDEYNGRFAITPEYPGGTYAYYTTVDEFWNSAYPYVVGPEYYGVVEEDNFVAMGGQNSVSISETVDTYDPSGGTTSTENAANQDYKILIYPNPATDFIAVQALGNLVKEEIKISLFSMDGRLVQSKIIQPGSTINYLDTRTCYNGEYLIRVERSGQSQVHRIVIYRD
ncbi:YHYH protein [bacterium SCSIO 12741]|nr:YHYH protein [bacterium SCSIO 12741]